jgi:pyridoxamine 5'-phosphate oxidase
MSNLQAQVAQLRREYMHASLDESSVYHEPFRQFRTWFDEALRAELPEANAMHLATCSAAGRPSGRIVLLKDLDERGFVFFTNYQSRKGVQMGENPHAALTFFWGALERQVRIEGMIEKIDAAASDEYFATRPLGAQIGAWASPQSRVINNRNELEAAVKQMEQKLGTNPPARPPHWGGYRLIPVLVEFWQGRESRLHDRIVYELQADGNWQIVRLAP